MIGAVIADVIRLTIAAALAAALLAFAIGAPLWAARKDTRP